MMSGGGGGEIGSRAERLAALVAALRDRETGCPWDLEQDCVSLSRFTIEEAYELAHAAVTPSYRGHYQEEMADVLFGVFLQAHVAAEQGAPGLGAVLELAAEKFTRRHPHVFGTAEERSARSRDEISAAWRRIKAEEVAARDLGQGEPDVAALPESVLGGGPALTRAARVGELAQTGSAFAGFQDRNALAALQAAAVALDSGWGRQPAEQMMIALGSLMFAAAQLCRALGSDPEQIAAEATHRTAQRYRQMVARARRRGVDLADASELDAIWQEIGAGDVVSAP